MSEAGALDTDIAKRFGVHVGTLMVWKFEYPEFREAINLNKDKADVRVEAALYSKAIEDKDTAALIFILKNRKKDEWRDGFVHRHEAPLAGEVASSIKDMEKDL